MNREGSRTSPSRGFILLTREPNARETGRFDSLLDLGYSLRSIAVTRTGPPPDPGVLTRALESLDSYGWVVFTSARAVRAVALAHPEKVRAISACRLGAVGPATGRAIDEILGRPPDLIPERFDAAHLAEALVAAIADAAQRQDQRVDDASIEPPRPRRVLFPAAENARLDLPRILSRAGIEVVAPAVYSVAPDPPTMDSLVPPPGWSEWSSIILTSGTAARILCDAVFSGLGASARGFLERSRPAVLGSAARAEVERHGVKVWLEASQPSLDQLALEMRDRLAQEP